MTAAAELRERQLAWFVRDHAEVLSERFTRDLGCR